MIAASLQGISNFRLPPHPPPEEGLLIKRNTPLKAWDNAKTRRTTHLNGALN